MNLLIEIKPIGPVLGRWFIWSLLWLALGLVVLLVWIAWLVDRIVWIIEMGVADTLKWLKGVKQRIKDEVG